MEYGVEIETLKKVNDSDTGYLNNHHLTLLLESGLIEVTSAGFKVTEEGASILNS